MNRNDKTANNYNIQYLIILFVKSVWIYASLGKLFKGFDHNLFIFLISYTKPGILCLKHIYLGSSLLDQ